MAKYTKEDILRIADEKNIRFLRLQFTDVLGALKSLEVTRSQFERALNNECTFDGSNVEGFVRVEESDMCLYPDYDTFTVFPWYSPMGEGKVARIICDVYDPDGMAFPGDPRYILKKALKKAAYLGFSFNAGTECEFYLFPDNGNGQLSTETGDRGGYFDMGPVDKGEECRREICSILDEMDFDIESAHHATAPPSIKLILSMMKRFVRQIICLPLNMLLRASPSSTASSPLSCQNQYLVKMGPACIRICHSLKGIKMLFMMNRTRML